MGLKARSQALLFIENLLVLLHKLAVLGIDPAHFFTQLNQGFLETVDHLAGVGLFFLVKAREALQQRFWLVIGVLMAAADRARLIILQLGAQLFDAGAAGQSLTFEQLLGDQQGLLGRLELFFGRGALCDQLFAFGQQSLQLELYRLQAGIQCELAAAQALQVFKRALLLTVISEQAAQGLDLLVDRLWLCFGLLEQYFQGVAQLVQFPGSQFGPLFEGG